MPQSNMPKPPTQNLPSGHLATQGKGRRKKRIKKKKKKKKKGREQTGGMAVMAETCPLACFNCSNFTYIGT
jgi:hypothetical protein